MWARSRAADQPGRRRWPAVSSKGKWYGHPANCSASGARGSVSQGQHSMMNWRRARSTRTMPYPSRFSARSPRLLPRPRWCALKTRCETLGLATASTRTLLPKPSTKSPVSGVPRPFGSGAAGSNQRWNIVPPAGPANWTTASPWPSRPWRTRLARCWSPARTSAPASRSRRIARSRAGLGAPLESGSRCGRPCALVKMQANEVCVRQTFATTPSLSFAQLARNASCRAPSSSRSASAGCRSDAPGAGPLNLRSSRIAKPTTP